MRQRGLFVGLATVDIHYLVDVFPEPDAKTNARGFLMATGGPACNAAATYAHLGEPARLLTRIGDHPPASFMMADLLRHGVDVIDLAPSSAALPTVSSVISIPSTGERTIVTHRPEMDLQVDRDQVAAALDGVDIVLVDGHYMNVGIAISAEASRRGIPVVLDGGSWKAGMDELLASVDVAICSESFRPPGTGSPEGVLNHLAGRGIGRSAVTMGGGAILCRERDEVRDIAVESVEVVDTSGAGDVLHGAYCHWHAAGANFTTALERAAEVATGSCRYFGARAWMDNASSA